MGRSKRLLWSHVEAVVRRSGYGPTLSRPRMLSELFSNGSLYEVWLNDDFERKLEGDISEPSLRWRLHIFRSKRIRSTILNYKVQFSLTVGMTSTCAFVFNRETTSYLLKTLYDMVRAAAEKISSNKTLASLCGQDVDMSLSTLRKWWKPSSWY